ASAPGGAELAKLRKFGDHGGGETPVPFPNTEVKPSSADGTVGVTRWESRSLPSTYKVPSPARVAGLYLFVRFPPFGAKQVPSIERRGTFGAKRVCLAGAAAAGAEGRDLSSLGGAAGGGCAA